MLSALKLIKRRLAENYYNEARTLEKDIDAAMGIFWKDDLTNLDLMHKNVTCLCEVQHYLIHQVMAIHKSECSLQNETLLKETRVFKSKTQAFESGKRAIKQYTFVEGIDTYFIGDLHSDDASLLDAINKISLFDYVVKHIPVRIIFTGDYVDRGGNHLKLLHRILLLKWLFPTEIFLLRGNHDGGYFDKEGEIVLPYRVPEEDEDHWYFPLYMKELQENNLTLSDKLLEDYFNLFESMAYIAHIMIGEHHIMALHGGLPRPSGKEDYNYLKTMADLTDRGIVDDKEVPITHNLMWSDPDRGEDNLRRHLKRFQFTEDNFNAFVENYKISYLVRGHEAVEEGYKEHFDGRCITLFSSGETAVEYTETAYPEITPKVLRIDDEGLKHYL